MTYKAYLLCLTFASLTCQQLGAAPFLRVHVPEATPNVPDALELENGDRLPVLAAGERSLDTLGNERARQHFHRSLELR